MTFWEFADKHASGLWMLTALAIVAGCVTVCHIADAFRKGK